jgi:hypothetical protein
LVRRRSGKPNLAIAPGMTMLDGLRSVRTTGFTVSLSSDVTTNKCSILIAVTRLGGGDPVTTAFAIRAQR